MACVDIGNLVCIVTMIVANVNADVYMHCPRGSNNRLKERSANRRNANRLFDSQVSFLFSSHTGKSSWRELFWFCLTAFEKNFIN